VPRKRTINVIPPLGGLDRSASYRGQPPYFSPDSKNVIPLDVYQDRARIGNRPRLGKAVIDRLGTEGSRPIRMINQVTVVQADGFTNWTDNFQGSDLGGAWIGASWIGGGTALPRILPSDAASITYGTAVGAVADAVGVLTSSPYTIEVFIAPWGGEHHGKYQIFGRMNDTTPVATTDGFVVELIMTGATGTWTGTIKSYNAEAETSVNLTAGAVDLGAAQSGWLIVQVSGTTITVFWNGTQIYTGTPTFGAGAGHRIGFGMECTEAGGVCLVDSFRTQYYRTDARETRRGILVASAGGKLYREGFIGRMSEISSSLTFNDDRQFGSVERGQILYIADFGEEIIDATASVAEAALTIDGVTETNVNKNDFVVTLTNVTGTATVGTYAISAVGTGSITLATAAGTGTCKARVERAPKSYNPATATIALVLAASGKGFAPLGSGIIALYNDRLCLAVDHICYQSRMADYTDWDYSQSDEAAAVATTVSDSTTGQLGDVITALIPFSDDYLLFGCQNSLWIQEGDIKASGRIRNVTYKNGVVGNGKEPGAYCYGPAGSLFFLSWDGIYMLEPGPTSYPKNISGQKVPRELVDVDTSTYHVCMSYDYRLRGVHIFLTSREETTYRLHWFYELQNQGFWPQEYDEDHEAFSMHDYVTSIGSANGTLVGGRDGYIRMHNRLNQTDDGEATEEFIEIGPLRLGDDFADGVIEQLIPVMSTEGSTVAWSIKAEDTHEAVAKASTARRSGTWEPGFNYKTRPNVRGGSAIIKIANGSAGGSWALERITAVIETRGPQRKQ
jgi:hypothetical protein